MKGACQGKTSPKLAMKSISSTASPQFTRKPRWHDSVVDLLADARQGHRSGLF